jgi:hypothetical protein
VALVRTNVSEDSIAPIFRVKISSNSPAAVVDQSVYFVYGLEPTKLFDFLFVLWTGNEL